MTHTLKYISTGTISALAILAFVAFFYQAKASPVALCSDQTSNSTTTTNYMSGGTGTTTLSLVNCIANQFGNDSAFVMFQYTSTSTAHNLVARVEHSQDNVDWYVDTTPLVGTATSTTLSGDAATYAWSISTSTDNGGTGTATRAMRSFSITTPTKYTRVIFSVPASGGNGVIWANAVSKTSNP